MNIEDDDNCNDCHELRGRLRVLRRKRVTAYCVSTLIVLMCVLYMLGRDRYNGLDVLEVREFCEVIKTPLGVGGHLS